MKFALPKGLFVFVCLLASTSAFAMELDAPVGPTVALTVETLQKMQFERRMSLSFRVKSAALLLDGSRELPSIDAATRTRVAKTVDATIGFLKGAAYNSAADLSDRLKAVDSIGGQYFRIEGIEDLLPNMERYLDRRDRERDQDVARHIRDVIKSEKQLREAIVKFGGPNYQFILSASIRQ